MSPQAAVGVNPKQLKAVIKLHFSNFTGPIFVGSLFRIPLICGAEKKKK